MSRETEIQNARQEIQHLRPGEFLLQHKCATQQQLNEAQKPGPQQCSYKIPGIKKPCCQGFKACPESILIPVSVITVSVVVTTAVTCRPVFFRLCNSYIDGPVLNSCAIQFCDSFLAAASSDISTKPKPLDLPVSLSLITLAEVTSP